MNRRNRNRGGGDPDLTNSSTDSDSDEDREPAHPMIYIGDEQVDHLVGLWLHWDKSTATTGMLKLMILENQTNNVRRAMLQRLTFGTAGLRGPMGVGFSRMNDLVVIQTTQGLLRYLESAITNAKKKGVVVGYDGRHNSRRFAELTVASFIGQGFTVYFYSNMCPTPFVPFAVRHFKCCCGVMITASHNPKNDNGYKVYWENGAQIISPHDREIQDSILHNLEPWVDAWKTSLAKTQGVIDPLPEVMDIYYSKVMEDSWREGVGGIVGKEKLRFTYTPMHGVGQVYMERAFKVAGLKPFISVDEQRDANPEFPTVRFPNPEEGKSALNLAIKTANKYNCRIILANDPDADRLAVAEKLPCGEWKIFNGNELGALLGWWAVYTHVMTYGSDEMQKCNMLASTVSSKILKSMAEEEGFRFMETLTGFKWMGNKTYDLLNNDCKVLFAFEEAIGFMCGTTVLDKDGISAAIRVAELAVYMESKGFTLMDQLNQIYKRYGYHVSKNSYFICTIPEVITSVFDGIRYKEVLGTRYLEYPTEILGGKYKVVAVRDLTVGHDSEQPNKRAVLPISRSSQMITFKFDNGLIATLRTSGTEPKVKYYTELRSAVGEMDWDSVKATLDEMVEAIIKEWLKPDEWATAAQGDDEPEKNGIDNKTSSTLQYYWYDWYAWYNYLFDGIAMVFLVLLVIRLFEIYMGDA